MGVFIPDDYRVANISNPTERQVAEIARDLLSDSWHIIANLDIAKETRPYEIDLLLLHKDYGLFALEIKGGPFEVRNGIWHRRHEIFTVSPPKQSQNSAYALRDVLRASDPSLARIHIEHGVVLPDVREGDFTNLPEILPTQLFLQTDLEDFKNAILNFALGNQRSGPLSDLQITAILEVIRPTLTFEWDPESQARNARISLERIMREQTRALATLDANKTVFVQGPAGTGKTRLALQWAQRAINRGDRTMIVSYNVPLGDFIKNQFSEEDKISAGPFEEIILMLNGMTEIQAPTNPDELSTWYEKTFPAHVLSELENITERFDTIIIDEVQDFFPMWIEVLLKLLDQDGPQRVLAVGDSKQNLYGRQGIEVLQSLTPTLAELSTNCRNTHQIGSLLHSLGGASAASSSPEGDEVFTIPVNSIAEAIAAVHGEIQSMQQDELRDMKKVVVITTSKNEKTAIQETTVGNISFVPWEQTGPNSVTCETIHRTKGLEYDTVLLVATNANSKRDLLYVGASRAISRLVIIGPPEVLQTLGID